MVTVQSREVSSDRNTRVSGARTSTSAAHAPIGASSVATRPASAADLPRIRPHPLPRDHTAHQYPAIFVNTGVNGSQPIPGKGWRKGLVRSLFPKTCGTASTSGGRLPGDRPKTACWESALEDCATNECIAVGESTEPLGDWQLLATASYWNSRKCARRQNIVSQRIARRITRIRQNQRLEVGQGKFFPGSSRREGSSFACETTYFKFGYLAQQYRTIWAVALTCQSEN